MFELEDIVREPFPKIGIIGVGGAAVQELCDLKNYSPSKVELKAVAVDIDNEELPTPDAPCISGIHFVEAHGVEGKAEQTHYLTLAEDMKSMTENIKSLLSEADFVIMASHLDSETEISIMPIIASACREMKVLTIGIVSMPADTSKQAQALECIAELKEIVNSLIIIPSRQNNDCLSTRSKGKEGSEFYEYLMSEAIRALVDPLALPNLICVSFEDLKMAFDHGGICHFTSASGNEAGQAITAFIKAVGDAYPILGASAIWICIECGPEKKLDEIGEVTDGIYKLVESDAFFVCSAVVNMSFTDTIRIRMLAAGYGDY